MKVEAKKSSASSASSPWDVWIYGRLYKYGYQTKAAAIHAMRKINFRVKDEGMNYVSFEPSN